MNQWLAQVAAETDRRIEEALTAPTDLCPPRLQESMRYACLSGGKRVRPALVCAAAQAATRTAELPTAQSVWQAAVAIELLHAFSLVHDDLPAMDDDELRRGKPTLHIAYDEATAILAGDALSVRCFELLSDPQIPPHIAIRLVREIASGIGWCGVIAGQVLDLAAEHQPNPTPEQVHTIHRLKTAALMRVSCRCGAIAVDADEPTVDDLSRFGELAGLAFQAVDDLLDELADPSLVGKKTKKDREKGKATLPAAIGVEPARQLAQAYSAEAAQAIQRFGPSAQPLAWLLDMVLQQLPGS